MASDTPRLTAAEMDRACAVLSSLVEQIEAGDLVATDGQLAHLRGSLAALEALGA